MATKKTTYKPPARKREETIFASLPSCMAEAKAFDLSSLKRNLQYRDRNAMESEVLKFQYKNKTMLEFLGISTSVRREGSYGGEVSLFLQSSNYAGAIPTVLPSNLQGGDLQVYPRFGNGPEEGMAQLTELLRLLNQTVSVEYCDSLPLKTKLQLQPPLYNEALKYLDLFHEALGIKWRKFRVSERIHSMPRGGTKWNKYANQYANPAMRLRFPSRDNILTTNHPEWQELRYVFDLAVKELRNPQAPARIREQCKDLIRACEQRVSDVQPRQTRSVHIHVSDPAPIKVLKEQATVILSRQVTEPIAWRIDIAEVFERYVQYVLEKAMAGRMSLYSNPQIHGQGIPSWGPQYLEPDILLRDDKLLLVADAKYKANMYQLNRSSAILKETFRHDLHQVLGYCSFAPQRNKLAIICYPYNAEEEVVFHPLSYRERGFSVNNTVLLVGLCFEAGRVEKTIQQFKEKIVIPIIDPLRKEE